ncbi:glycosyltransferase [Sphingomonas sp. JC676]|uniref:glycosyltransferase n=1 Tax=Sphingomonas sp. JC676 TaxID=2768065 RepID=UPI0016583FDB|nr:glycosyltransferase [Sphingomonas sp. JC676]MBC9030943.1 glycosyltransferase [Sphingomonas sp. JC676]
MNIIAIIVTYQSNLQVLREIIRVLTKQCYLIIADNSLAPADRQSVEDCLMTDGGAYIPMHGNRGIGAAQNKAIALAWSKGAEAVLLLDDDSIPPPDLIDHLRICAQRLGGHAVVGANAVDSLGREISNARHVPGNMPECRDMMSSGALIRREIFERVGSFDESLFVDGVDFDWGWRARRAGIALHLCRATSIQHRLGEGDVAGVRYPSPVRHYFQYRNILRLMGRSYVPWRWRLSQMIKLPTKLLLIAALMPQKSRRLQFAFAGIWDAMLGRSGPWPAPRKSDTKR